jgi:ZIP family zinc transporter
LWRAPSHKTLCALVSFAAGALLSVTVVEIIPEAVRASSWGMTAASTLVGLVAFYLIGKYVYYVCPACAASATGEKRGYVSLGILLMVALGIHSTVDGLAIAAGERTHHELVAYLILFAVSYHKVPEGLALVSVARLAGYSRAKALLATILIELTTAFGAFLGLFALRSVSPNSPWLGIHLGLVAGSFIYIVGFALIREMMEHEKKSILGYVLLGFASIVATGLLLQSFGIGEGH